MAVAVEDFKRACEVLAGGRAVLCVSHTRPDGDAIGSVLGLRALLRTRGLRVTALMLDPPTPRYAWLLDDDPPAIWTRDQAAVRGEAFDAVLIADTASARQLEPVLGYLESLAAPRIIVDHHATRDVAAHVALIDETAAATCELILEWAEALDWPVPPEAAEALFTGLATDTGWFRFPSVDERAMRAAQRLVAMGADPHRVYERLYAQESAARLRLTAAMLATLELRAGGRLAVVELIRDAFRRCGATPADTEELVNEPARIGGVEVVLLFVEQEDGQVRVSFRSKPPAGGLNRPFGPGLDVAALAAEFGGGGHARAAGARIRGSLPEVRRQVIARVESELLRSADARHDLSGLRTRPT